MDSVTIFNICLVQDKIMVCDYDETDPITPCEVNISHLQKASPTFPGCHDDESHPN